MKKEITKYYCLCDRCQWTWTTRGDTLPAVCPNCKSNKWDSGQKEAPSVATGDVIPTLTSTPSYTPKGVEYEPKPKNPFKTSPYVLEATEELTYTDDVEGA